MSYERNRKERRSVHKNQNDSVGDSMPKWLDMSNLDHWGQLGLRYAPHYYHNKPVTKYSPSMADTQSSGDASNEPFSKRFTHGTQRRKIAIILFVIGLILIVVGIIPVLVLTLKPAESQPDKILVATMKLSVDEIFQPDYYDQSSLKYQSFVQNFSTAIDQIYRTSDITGYNGIQIQQLKNGSIVVIFIIVIEVRHADERPGEKTLEAIITGQDTDTTDGDIVVVSNFRIKKTSVSVVSTEEVRVNPVTTTTTTTTKSSTTTSTPPPSSSSSTTTTKTTTTAATTTPMTSTTTTKTTIATGTTGSTSPSNRDPNTTSMTTSTTASTTTTSPNTTTFSTPSTAMLNATTTITTVTTSSTVQTTPFPLTTSATAASTTFTTTSTSTTMTPIPTALNTTRSMSNSTKTTEPTTTSTTSPATTYTISTTVPSSTTTTTPKPTTASISTTSEPSKTSTTIATLATTTDLPNTTMKLSATEFTTLNTSTTTLTSETTIPTITITKNTSTASTMSTTSMMKSNAANSTLTTSKTTTTNPNITTTSKKETSATTSTPIITSTMVVTNISPETTSTTTANTTYTTTTTSSTMTSLTSTADSTRSTSPTTTSTTAKPTTPIATPVEQTSASEATAITTQTQTATTVTNPEIYFTKTFYSGFIESSTRLTCHARGIPLSHLQLVTITRDYTFNGTESVAAISIDGTKNSTFLSITISSESFINSSGANIYVDFQRLTCDDERNYYCTAGPFSATATLRILRKPKILDFKFPYGILENSNPGTFNCTAEVGYPAGRVVIEINKNGSFVEHPFLLNRHNVSSDDCSNVQTVTFSYTFDSTWNSTAIQCKVENLITLEENDAAPSVAKTLAIVPGNICTSTTFQFLPYPYDCKYYIWCAGQVFIQTCGDRCGTRVPSNDTACVDCALCQDYQTTKATTVLETLKETTNSTLETTITTASSTTIVISNETTSTKPSSASSMTTITEKGSGITTASSIMTTPTPSEVHFTKTSYTGYIGLPTRLTCQVREMSLSGLYAVVINRDSTSIGAEFVVSISTDGTKNSSIHDITISSESFINSSEATIHVDFQKLTCDDERNYYCIVGTFSASATLRILRKPTILDFKFPFGILENSNPGTFNCTAEVGYPVGRIVIEVTKNGSFVQAPFHMYTQMISSNDCSNIQTVTFSHIFDFTWNNTAIQCRVDNNITLEHNEEPPSVTTTVQIVPGNVCTSTTFQFLPYPYDCKYYIWCAGQVFIQTCGDRCGTRIPSNDTACVDCTLCQDYQTTNATTVLTTLKETTNSTLETTITTASSTTIVISNGTTSRKPTSASSMTTITEKGSGITTASSIMTTPTPSEVHFTKTSYTGYIGLPTRLTCQVREMSSSGLYAVVINRDSTSIGAEFVVSISTDGTKNSSIHDITISSESFINSSEATIHVDFQKLTCDDERNYYCIVGTFSASSTLRILRKPAILDFKFPFGILENSNPGTFNCTAEVGYPVGRIVIEVTKNGSFVQAPFHMYTQMISSNDCSNIQTVTFSHIFDFTWNNTAIQCRVDNNITLEHNEEPPSVTTTVQIVPGNICTSTTYQFVPYPYDCKYYIWCAGQVFIQTCGDRCGTRIPSNNTACDDCTLC